MTFLSGKTLKKKVIQSNPGPEMSMAFPSLNGHHRPQQRKLDSKKNTP